MDTLLGIANSSYCSGISLAIACFNFLGVFDIKCNHSIRAILCLATTSQLLVGSMLLYANYSYISALFDPTQFPVFLNINKAILILLWLDYLSHAALYMQRIQILLVAVSRKYWYLLPCWIVSSLLVTISTLMSLYYIWPATDATSYATLYSLNSVVQTTVLISAVYFVVMMLITDFAVVYTLYKHSKSLNTPFFHNYSLFRVFKLVAFIGLTLTVIVGSAANAFYSNSLSIIQQYFGLVGFSILMDFFLVDIKSYAVSTSAQAASTISSRHRANTHSIA
jgi:hypothetical protein